MFFKYSYSQCVWCSISLVFSRSQCSLGTLFSRQGKTWHKKRYHISVLSSPCNFHFYLFPCAGQRQQIMSWDLHVNQASWGFGILVKRKKKKGVILWTSQFTFKCHHSWNTMVILLRRTHGKCDGNMHQSKQKGRIIWVISVLNTLKRQKTHGKTQPNWETRTFDYIFSNKQIQVCRFNAIRVRMHVWKPFSHLKGMG